MLPPPENFQYNPLMDILSWETIPDAEEYWIEITAVDVENWHDLYIGTNTSCPVNKSPGQYAVRGRTKDRSTWGNPGKPKTITVS